MSDNDDDTPISVLTEAVNLAAEAGGVAVAVAKEQIDTLNIDEIKETARTTFDKARGVETPINQEEETLDLPTAEEAYAAGKPSFDDLTWIGKIMYIGMMLATMMNDKISMFVATHTPGALKKDSAFNVAAKGETQEPEEDEDLDIVTAVLQPEKAISKSLNWLENTLT